MHFTLYLQSQLELSLLIENRSCLKNEKWSSFDIYSKLINDIIEYLMYLTLQS